MKILRELSKYLIPFIFAVLVIAVYKTFDNISYIIKFFGALLKTLRPFFIGFVLAYILLTPCRFFERLFQKSRYKFLVAHKRALSVAMVYIMFFAIIALALLAIIPSIIASLTDFYTQLPSFIMDFVSWFNGLNIEFKLGSDTLQQLFNNDFFSVEKIMSWVNFDNVNKYAQGVVSIGSSVFNIFLGIIISVYILIDRSNFKEGLKRLARSTIGCKTRKFIVRYLRLINEFANKYIYCMVIDAVIIFIASFIVLSIEGVKYAPMLAFLMGILNIIPYFGAIISTVITGCITVFTGSLTQAIIAVISMVVLQQLDANLIQPRLLSGSLQIKPFWVIFGILLGSSLFGILGFFLAVPLTALIKNMLIDYMEHRENKTSEGQTLVTDSTQSQR